MLTDLGEQIFRPGYCDKYNNTLLPLSDLLEQTFKALHFRVAVHKWLRGHQILTAIQETIRQREYTEGDAFVCCIISRGTSNHLLGTDSCITGLHMDRVSDQFTANGCPALVGKPKLLFLQRYSVAEFQPRNRRDHRDEDLETDGFKGHAADDSIPEFADVFWSHCWTDGRQLEEGPHYSAYLKALTRALLKGHRRYPHQHVCPAIHALFPTTGEAKN